MSFKNAVLSAVAVFSLAAAANAQVLLSGGLNYSQNFDSLVSGGTSAATWTDNSTLPGWYHWRMINGGVLNPTPYVTYRVSGGAENAGFAYSFGTNGVNAITDRALGSISSGTPQTNSFGVRFQNDTASILSSITVSYTGEQWRNGGNTAAQPMSFYYMAGSTPILNPDPASTNSVNGGWISFPLLTFTTPTVGSTAGPLDGNALGNRTLFSAIVLTGLQLNPGDELFLRWVDINDTGNDHGFGVDDMTVTFTQVPEPAAIALLAFGSLGLILARRRVQ